MIKDLFREKWGVSVAEQPRPATAKVANLILNTVAEDEGDFQSFRAEFVTHIFP
jgi:hypothetical protein